MKTTYLILLAAILFSCAEKSTEIDDLTLPNSDTVLLNVKYGNHPEQM